MLGRNRPDTGWTDQWRLGPGRLLRRVDVEVVPGGKRRIDKVLAEDFLTDISSLGLADVRALRDEADQEETDLSYLRRLLQGRIDLVAAEVRQRGTGEDSELVGQLPSILADETPRQPAFGLGRHRATEPTNAGASRRAEEKLAAVDVTDLATRTDDELSELLEILRRQEREVSDNRRRVQAVFDNASAELTRRYRDGEANVNALLADEAGAGPDS